MEDDELINVMKKGQDDDLLDETYIGHISASKKVKKIAYTRDSNLDNQSCKDIRTTEGCCANSGDESYDENTNCRLREETNGSMMFHNQSNPVNAPVNLTK